MVVVVAVEVVAAAVAAVAGGHLHEERHLDLERSKLHYELGGVLVGFREETDREERDRVVRPRRVQRLEERAAVGVGRRLLQHLAELEALVGGEEDEVEGLHHLRGELEVAFRLERPRQRDEDAARVEELAQLAHHQRASLLEEPALASEEVEEVVDERDELLLVRRHPRERLDVETDDLFRRVGEAGEEGGPDLLG